MALRYGLFLLAALTLPAAAQNVPPLTGKPCLQTGSIADYHPLPGYRALVVIDRSRRQYRVSFATVCDSLQIHPDLGFKTFNPSQYACLSPGDNVYSSRDVGANRLCRIQAIDFFNENPTPPPEPPPAPVTGRRVG
jgi:hypothetical protein